MGFDKCNSLVIGLMRKALVAQTTAMHKRQKNNLNQLFDDVPSTATSGKRIFYRVRTSSTTVTSASTTVTSSTTVTEAVVREGPEP